MHLSKIRKEEEQRKGRELFASRISERGAATLYHVFSSLTVRNCCAEEEKLTPLKKRRLTRQLKKLQQLVMTTFGERERNFFEVKQNSLLEK